MSTFIKIIIIIFIVITGVTLITDSAEAAILSISPQQKTFAKGETFLVEIHLNSEQEVVNAVEAQITYPSEYLEVMEVSHGGSLLTLWVKEPAHEETAGIISLAGGIPGGSYVVDGKVATITFKTKIEGTAEVSFDPDSTSVRLNDGRGTKAELKFISGVYQVSSASFIVISSPTHPDENAWYKNRTFTVDWDMKPQADYSYILSDNPDEEPDNHREATTGTVTFSDLADGIYYFILKERIAGGEWQLVGKRRAMIDNQPPLPIEVVVSQDSTLFNGKYFLIFSTVDKISGVDYYDIIEGGKIYHDVTSPYVLLDQLRKSAVIVRAFDKAGNSIDVKFGGISGSSSEVSVSKSVYSLPIILLIGIIALLLLLFSFKMRSKD